MRREISLHSRAGDSKLHVALDASRSRSGGGKAHLLGIIRAGNPRRYGIHSVHVWSYQELIRELPDLPWLHKHSPSQLNRSLLRQLWWQYYSLPKEIVTAGCSVLLSTDAGTVCRFSPSIVMSRDMLSFEGKEMQRYPLFSFQRLRLFLLKHMQVASLRRASAVLFLTEYAARVIQRFTGQLAHVRIIPHGIGEQFRQQGFEGNWKNNADSIECVYVSNTDMYKHQWNVVRAIAILRRAGYPVTLKLVGGSSRPAQALLDDALAQEDPDREFVEVLSTVPHEEVPSFLAHANIFVFASSCENMPNTLIEPMASELPIASSDRGPMPEILQDAGVYFDPENPLAIAEAVGTLIDNPVSRKSKVKSAKDLSDEYSWSRCARETWKYLTDVATRPN